MNAPNQPREIALMFSGGIDSTVAAAKLAETHERVHLLTWRNGHGHWGFSRVRRRAEEVASRYPPGRVVHQLADIRDLFRELAIATMVADAREYGGHFVWCLGCKLAMHAASLRYCLQNGLSTMADGSAADTDEMVEQSLIALSLTYQMYADHGVEFTAPVYEMTRDEKRAWLKERGYNLGIQIGDRHLGVQPTCHAGELAYLSYVLFNKAVNNPEHGVAGYIESRRPFIDEWVTRPAPEKSATVPA